MDKTLQTTAWNCLPREFKEEVKKEWELTDNAERLPHDAFLRGKYQMMRDLFGLHNLTSDAEEEDEMLYVSRKQIDALQGEIFKAIMDAHDADDWQDAAHYILDVMPRLFAALFGSKCLPEVKPTESGRVKPKPAEPKFKVGDKVRINGGGYEPNLHKGDIGEILDINDRGQCFVLFSNSQAWIYNECIESYTEPVGTKDDTKDDTKAPTFTDDCQSQCKSPDRLRIAAMPASRS